MDTAPQSFEEFWPYYVSQHADPRCRALHVVGTSIALGCVALAPLRPRLLLAAPVIGYGMAWIGHFAFERNRPASWHSPKHFAWSFRGDMKMLALSLQGRMDDEVARVLATADLEQSPA
jgi:hypothetical protein